MVPKLIKSLVMGIYYSSLTKAVSGQTRTLFCYIHLGFH